MNGGFHSHRGTPSSSSIFSVGLSLVKHPELAWGTQGYPLSPRAMGSPGDWGGAQGSQERGGRDKRCQVVPRWGWYEYYIITCYYHIVWEIHHPFINDFFQFLGFWLMASPGHEKSPAFLWDPQVRQFEVSKAELEVEVNSTGKETDTVGLVQFQVGL